MSASEWVHVSAPYVRPRERGQRDAWSEEAAAAGRTGGQRVLGAGETAASEAVARALGVGPGENVVTRRRMIYLDGTPIELTDSYFLMQVAGGTRLVGTAKIPGGVVTLLAERGYRPDLVQEDVTARLPTTEEQELLLLEPSEPVLCLARTTSDTAGDAFQFDVSVFPASSQRLRYRLKVG
ncbi:MULTISPECIES: UTRA domain-containing protein [unclassified Streptomyces]|uniref:UTRA domain-containing protein n=1 Tax=unclassified Streptomyces TaxID=2593676 RepID=UPI000CD56BB8|nr:MULTISPECIES: UTRA domain-containing protein [unclassified Streptomyces]